MVSLYGNYSSAAEFFVFVGVMAFLYALAATVVYVIWDENYQQNDKLPIVVSHFQIVESVVDCDFEGMFIVG